MAVAHAVEVAGPLRARVAAGCGTDDEVGTLEYLDEVAFRTVRRLLGLEETDDARFVGPRPASAHWFAAIGLPLRPLRG